MDRLGHADHRPPTPTHIGLMLPASDDDFRNAHQRDDARSSRGAHAAVYGLLAVIMVVAVVRSLQRPQPVDTSRAPEAESLPGVDPNVAAWYDLARLPGIGETKARQIIAFRESARSGSTGRASGTPAFAIPDDLQAVSGIGPKTVERIRPYLHFPERTQRTVATDGPDFTNR